jgi:hypothetical protein
MKYSILLSILVLNACESPQTRMANIMPEFDHSTLPVQELSGKLLVRDESIGFPSDMLIIGHYVVIADFATRGGGALHVVDLSTGKMRVTAGTAGGGPGEFSSSPQLLRDVNGPEYFWTYDPNASRLMKIDLARLLVNRDYVESTVPLTFPRMMYAMDFVGPGRLVGLGLSAEGRIAMVDLKSGTIRYSGALPKAVIQAPGSVIQHAYQSALAVRPDLKRVVLAHWRGGGFEVFDADGKFVSEFDGPFPFEPDFVVDRGPRGPIMRGGWNNRYGYLDVVATDSVIVALFSGRAEAHYRGDAWIGEYVHIFSWSGELLGVFRLDRAAHNIALAKDGRTLLAAIVVDPEFHEPAIMKYILPHTYVSPAKKAGHIP